MLQTVRVFHTASDSDAGASSAEACLHGNVMGLVEVQPTLGSTANLPSDREAVLVLNTDLESGS